MEIKIIFPGGAVMSCPSKESAQAALGNYHFPPEVTENVEEEVPSTDVDRAPVAGVEGRPHEGETFQSAISRTPDSEHLTDSEKLGYYENDDRDPPSAVASSATIPENGTYSAPNMLGDLGDDDTDNNDDGSDDYSSGSPDTARSVSMYESHDDDDRIDSLEEPILSDSTGTMTNPNTRGRHDGSSTGKKRWIPLPGINALLAPSKKMNKRTQKIYEFIRDRLVFTTKEVRKFARKNLGMKMGRKNRKKIRRSLKFLEAEMIIERVGWDDTQGTNWRKAS